MSARDNYEEWFIKTFSSRPMPPTSAPAFDFCWAGYQAGAASRDAELAELVAALATLVRLSPADVECDNMHHTKFDQHKYDETCHVVTRYAESRSYAQELVAKLRKPK